MLNSDVPNTSFEQTSFYIEAKNKKKILSLLNGKLKSFASLN